MEACLARLYVDEPFRKLFYLDPTTLNEYWLTDKEAASLRGIDRAMLEHYAGSLKNKRRGRIERAYPMLFRLYPDEVAKYFSRYYQLYTSKVSRSPQQEVCEFGEFIEESMAGTNHMPSYAADIARYERLYYEMLSSAGFRASTAEGVSNRMTDQHDVPFLRDGVEMADFEYDVAEIEDRLHGGDTVPHALDLARVPLSIAFRPSTRTSAAKMLRLNAATRAVLERCDGSHTVGAITSELEAALGGQNLGPNVAAVVDRLLALEVLTLDPQFAASDKHNDSRAFGSAETEAF